MSISQRVNMFLGEAINLASPYSELQALKSEMLELKGRLNKPLRVAVVGLIKAGKSTLMNAIMGEKLVITGGAETTYTPSWFKYSKKPGITVVLDNGKRVEGSFSDINYWTVRNSGNPDLDRVTYVEIKSSNPIFKELELIDTPGLESTYGKDSDNTLKFMGLNKNDTNKITMVEASNADALVYAFNRNMGERDEELLKAFQGPMFSNATPINAIGILTRVDDYWTSNEVNPLQEAMRIVNRLENIDKVKSVLYNILPVIGKIAETRGYLDEDDMKALKELSELPEKRFERLILNSKKFCEREYEEVKISLKARDTLWSKLGQYGVYLAVTSLMKGEPQEKLSEILYENSGVNELMNIIKQHFGSRAFLIKLKYITNRIKTKCYMLMNNEARNNLKLLNVLECILSGCEKLEDEEHAFKEFKILQNYYGGTLRLYNQEEEDDLLRITGEKGSNCEARLGAAEGTTVRELAKIAKEKAELWNMKANEGMNSSEYEEAARILARSLEIMYSYLNYLSGYR